MSVWRQLLALFLVMMRQGGPLGALIRKYGDRERWESDTKRMLDEYAARWS
jgi:hypothetical protein